MKRKLIKYLDGVRLRDHNKRISVYYKSDFIKMESVRVLSKEEEVLNNFIPSGSQWLLKKAGITVVVSVMTFRANSFADMAYTIQRFLEEWPRIQMNSDKNVQGSVATEAP